MRWHANSKSLSASSEQRDEQFGYIAKQKRRFLGRRLPIISVDTKKKELVGNFKNSGRVWSQGPCRLTIMISGRKRKAGQPVRRYDLAATAGRSLWESLMTPLSLLLTTSPGGGATPGEGTIPMLPIASSWSDSRGGSNGCTGSERHSFTRTGMFVFGHVSTIHGLQWIPLSIASSVSQLGSIGIGSFARSRATTGRCCQQQTQGCHERLPQRATRGCGLDRKRRTAGQAFRLRPEIMIVNRHGSLAPHPARVLEVTH